MVLLMLLLLLWLCWRRQASREMLRTHLELEFSAIQDQPEAGPPEADLQI